MYQYPSILGPNKAPHLPCIAFEKLDGSNLRWEWSRKQGWNKFGTRRHLFDHTDETFAPAIKMFLDKYGDALVKVVKDSKAYRNADKFIAFTEFFGPNSFAGQHLAADEKKLVLFDVEIHKKGLVSPRDFINDFGHLEIPKVVYEGVLNDSLVADVKAGRYPVYEGVVCKGGSGHDLWMRKIKTAAYMARLKQVFPENWEEFGE